MDDFCRRPRLRARRPSTTSRRATFRTTPSPGPRNAGEVSSIVRITGADAGFLLNSDVSRVSIVAEDGETLSEEYTFPSSPAAASKRSPGPIVTNPSTSRMIEDVAARGRRPRDQDEGRPIAHHPVAPVRGRGHRRRRQRRRRRPGFQPAFDGFLTMGLVLEAMAPWEEEALRARPGTPQVPHRQGKDLLPAVPGPLGRGRSAKKLFRPESPLLIDGVRAEGPDGWVHVRASATEPMIRVIAENRSQEKAQEDLDRVPAFVSQLI